MRTTIEIPDEIFRKAKIRAVQEGVPLRELITRYVEHGLTFVAPGDLGTAERIGHRRSDLPVARKATGAVIPCRSSAELDAILDEQYLET